MHVHLPFLVIYSFLDKPTGKNDGNDPEFMKEVQRLNYLYISKEECCKVSLPVVIPKIESILHPFASSHSFSFCFSSH